MAALTLALYVVWGALAFGLRTLVQWRRTGDTGLRIARGGAGSAEWVASGLFTAALVTGLAAPLADLGGLAEPIGALDHAGAAMAGIVVAVIGITGTVATQLAMGDSWRVGVDATERTALVTAGPFRVVRNPIFTAMGVTAVGLALMVPNAVALAGLTLLALALELQVRVVEEPHLRETHGAAYQGYATRVGRFVPAIGRNRHRRPERTG
jgi:protein-S-isoprenylcysteine O-methyltransferase Ste14